LSLCFGLVASVLVLVAERPARAALEPGRACERAAAEQLEACLRKVHGATRRCFRASARVCEAENRAIRAAVSRLEASVLRSCPDPATIASAGFGPLLAPGALADRLVEACTGDPATLAARTFGGPHGAVLRRARDADDRCLLRAHREAARSSVRALALQSDCVLRERSGQGCDAAAVSVRVALEEARARARIDSFCADLPGLIGLDTATYVERAIGQARCAVPVVHGDTAPLALDCGPRPAVPVPARGTATQVVLAESEWGTRCGDGSPYAFWIQLPPAGVPAENVLFFMQGGGVCVFEDQCDGVSAGLLRALDNNLPTGGVLSSTNAANPFRDFTKVYLPYCTQDVHFGGGATSEFPSVTVHRFGGLNVRAALRYVRDVLWAELDATTPEGYRPDRLRVFLTGGSAGGFGAAYHFHYPIDELRWTRTSAVPDASLGLDNGNLLGVTGLGIVFVSASGWNSRSLLPAYCHTPICAVVPVLEAAHSARLGVVPEQVLLNVSNQVDNTQVATTFFPSLRSWIDALRVAYCENQGLPGVRSFLPAVTSSIHTTIASSAFFPSGLSSDGVTLGAWLGGAIADPGGVVDRVEEGAIASTHGAQPFACPVGGG
jgi:hypothetical protein